MTIADDLRRECREEGMQQGIEITALNMLDDGFSFDIVSKITGLTINHLFKPKGDFQ